MKIARGMQDRSAEHDAKLESLTRRLVDGEARIEAAQRRGEDVAAWEAFWLQLLHEYETQYNQPEADRSGIAA